jgi:2-oxoisovalerate dehydrogenase E1 component alpha subunit
MDALRVYRLMSEARALEERMVKISKTEHGYFWIGGPGEEAFNVPLGLLVHRGEGPAHDYLHLHYRSSAILLAMGMNSIDALRQMCSRATDPFTGGRNFINHFARRAWNVLPGTSTIETQYAVAPGTALAQRRHGGRGITIVNGGDAGTAEGDFATCLNWASRPGRELPILIIVVNNRWGISTPFEEVHGDRQIIRRCEPFGIRWDTVDGNDPYASWALLSEAMAYVREERKPFGIEAFCSRLHGHSSSSGGARVDDEPDCLKTFERSLIDQGLLTAEAAERLRGEHAQAMLEGFQKVIDEPIPESSAIFDHVFA